MFFQDVGCPHTRLPGLQGLRLLGALLSHSRAPRGRVPLAPAGSAARVLPHRVDRVICRGIYFLFRLGRGGHNAMARILSITRESTLSAFDGGSKETNQLLSELGLLFCDLGSIVGDGCKVQMEGEILCLMEKGIRALGCGGGFDIAKDDEGKSISVYKNAIIGGPEWPERLNSATFFRVVKGDATATLLRGSEGATNG